MTTEINVCGDANYERLFLNAIAMVMTDTKSSHYNPELGEKMAEGGPHPDIRVTVNGVEIPFLEALKDGLERLEQQFDQRASEVALKMLEETGLKESILDFWRVKRKFYENLKALGYELEEPRDEW